MSDSPATQAVQNWLNALDKALQANDAKAAAALFEEEGFWRDLVSFTWNIKTLEGRDAIEAMLNETNARVKPAAWAIEEEPTEADGITESWITFETDVARGRGHVRLRDGKAFTLLTTMVELKGHEEPNSTRRPMGVELALNRVERTGPRSARKKQRHWATRSSPIVWLSVVVREA